MRLIKQKENNDCGIAVIRMLYNHYFETDLNDFLIKADNHIGSSGINISQFEEIARKHHLICESYQASFNELIKLKDDFLVCLLKNEDFNHFVIVKKNANSFLIFDPGSTYKKRISYKEFESIFSGILITIKPDIDNYQPIDYKTSFSFKNLINIKCIIVFLFIELLITATSIGLTFLFKILINDIVNTSIINNILIIITTFIFIKLINLIGSNLLSIWQQQIIKNRYQYWWSQLLYTFCNHKTIKIVKDDIGIIYKYDDFLTTCLDFYIKKISSFINNLLIVIIAIFLLYRIHIFFLFITLFQSFVSLVYLILNLLWFRGYNQRSKELQIKQQTYLYEFHKTIVNSMHEKFYKEWIKNVNDVFGDNLNLNQKIHYSANVSNGIFELIKYFITSITLVVGISLIINLSTIDLATLIYVSTLQGLLIGSIDGLIKFINESYEFNIANNKIVNLLLLRKESNDLINFSRKIRSVEFKNIFLFFDNTPIISDLNLFIDKPTFLIARNASGKSTLMKAVIKRQLLSSGEIKINELNINKYSNEWFLKHVVYLSDQRSNVELSNEWLINFMKKNKRPELLKIIEYFKLFDADKYNLSSGQNQVLKLLHSYNSRNKLFLLDEVLNNIDESIKHLIFEIIVKQIIKNNLTIMIEHDNSFSKYFENQINLHEYQQVYQ
ncbi:cysteine peptidase family C39 domain-containing protein [Mycoplasma bradburyae]|uniref:cysteine peptidase family C39 domain-containing protein n=1 Tax=Mycoplasma bradburyae TaxID=2963128 RepID=UPI00234182E7|nr:cysteine peptidase family C39 domain-containing protein [Mycoplasma bradburyae]MDC4182741.1 ATP-binding cassette domain-containing protein [Mycoplasma bradburyae]